MSKVLVNNSSLADIAAAIREKNESDTKYKPAEMGAAIRDIESGGGDFVGIKYSDFDSYRGSPRVADARNLPAENTIFGGYHYIFANVSKNPNGGFHSLLETVYLPKLYQFGSNLFYNCTKLKNIYGDFESVKAIQISAFYCCTSLEKIEWNMSQLENIYNTAFNTTGLKVLKLTRQDKIVNLAHIGAFYSTPIENGTGFIYVPKALIETYKTATNWVTYASQFRALEDYTVDGTITGALDESKIAA